MSKPLVSIIILNFNGLTDTFKCLNSLKKTKYKNIEIIVIDNGSENNEAINIKARFGNFIQIYRLNKNKGFTGGNNWALKKTQGKYIVLLNNDTTVESSWLDPLVEKMDSDKKIAVAQPKIRMLNKKNYFDYAGAAGGYIDKYGYPFTRGRIFNTQEKDIGQYDNECDIFWASGSACIIRKSFINKVGGLFNPNLFNYMEEIDFCWRCWRKGYRVVFVPKSLIYHKGAATAGKNIVQKRFWEHRNNLYILLRNLERKNLLKILPVRFFLELITYVYYIVSRQQIFLISLSKAHVDFIKNGFYIRLLRNRKLNNTKAPIYPGSIIFDHYIKKIKTYDSLNWSSKGNIAYLVLDTKNTTGARVVFKTAHQFIKKGYRVRVYTIFGKKPVYVNFKIEVKNLLRSFTDLTPDILVATFWPTSYIVFLMKARKRFYFSQDWEEDFYKNHLIRNLAKTTYTLPIEKFAISKFHLNRIKKFDKSGYSTHLIKNTLIDKNIFYPNKGLYSKKKMGVIRILSVISWYNQHKGPDILVRIVVNLRKKYKNYHFTLVSLEKKPYENVFDKFISGANHSQLANLYRKSDILLVTSRSEGFFLPGLEAMACGCLVITTNCGGISDYAQHNKNAIIIKNVEDLWRKDIINKTYYNGTLRKHLISNGLSISKKYYIENLANDQEKYFFT